MRNVNFGLSNVSFGQRNVSFGQRNVSCGLSNVSCGLSNVSCGLSNVSYGLSNVSYGLSNVSCVPTSADEAVGHFQPLCRRLTRHRRIPRYMRAPLPVRRVVWTHLGGICISQGYP